VPNTEPPNPAMCGRLAPVGPHASDTWVPDAPCPSRAGAAAETPRDRCCDLPEPAATESHACPSNGRAGRKVGTITLKALLLPPALATFEPAAEYRYCPDPACDTVYYGGGHEYRRADVEVPVYAKEAGDDVPVCYCFGWTRRRLREAGPVAAEQIRGHVQAGRCGCEVNNPKGRCCLGDVHHEMRPH